MGLTANVGTKLRTKWGEIQSYPVAGGVHIYRGAVVTLCLAGSKAGYAQPATNEADDASKQIVVGIAWEEADNSSGSNGDKNVRVYDKLKCKLTLNNAQQSDIGKLAVVHDDETVTTYQSSGYSNVIVGRISELLGGNEVFVDLSVRPARVASAAYD